MEILVASEESWRWAPTRRKEEFHAELRGGARSDAERKEGDFRRRVDVWEIAGFDVGVMARTLAASVGRKIASSHLPQAEPCGRPPVGPSGAIRIGVRYRGGR